MKIYNDFAHLYGLFSPREDYVEEAEILAEALRRVCAPPAETLLELGCGPGHLASWMRGFTKTLSDLSPKMVAMAAEHNPGARCVQGDMRTLRLKEQFDVVLVHDAICYMLDLDDLRAALKTTFAHTRPGGTALMLPDLVKENFQPQREVGGWDGDGESLSFVADVWQRAGQSDGYVVDYIFGHRVGEGPPSLHHERHHEGLFSVETWLRELRAAGFEAWSEAGRGGTTPILFWGRRPL